MCGVFRLAERSPAACPPGCTTAASPSCCCIAASASLPHHTRTTPALPHNRKSSKYKTPTVPYPHTSRDTYERAMRQPLGPEYNTGAVRV